MWQIDVVRESQLRDAVLTTAVEHAEGYIDGFYIGSPTSLVRVLRRFDKFEYYMHIHRDYEWVLKQSFERHGIRRLVTDMVFFKVRANRDFWYFGRRNTSNLSLAKQQQVRLAYQSLTESVTRGARRPPLCPRGRESDGELHDGKPSESKS